MWIENVFPYCMYGNDGATRRSWPAAYVIWDCIFTLGVVAGNARSVARVRLGTG